MADQDALDLLLSGANQAGPAGQAAAQAEAGQDEISPDADGESGDAVAGVAAPELAGQATVTSGALPGHDALNGESGGTAAGVAAPERPDEDTDAFQDEPSHGAAESGDTAPGAAPEPPGQGRDARRVLAGELVPVARSTSTEIVLASEAVSPVASDDTPAELDWLASAGAGVLDWAWRRRLGLPSACGISLALALCAAGWLSSGTRTDVARGVATLWAAYLVLRASYRLDRMAAADHLRRRPAAVPPRWLAALTGTLTECLAYAGLAAGASAERWRGVWPLAVAVLGLTSVRSLMTACSVPPGFGARPSGPLSRISAVALTMPVGGRILLAGFVAPIWGPRTALYALADWSVVAIVFGLAGRASQAADTVVRRRDDGALARSLGRLVRGALVPLPPAALGLVAVAALGLVGLRGLPAVLLLAPVLILFLLAAPGSSHPHAGRLDWLVPALLLGAQICYLAAVGRSAHVAWPVTFALVAALVLHYTELCSPGRPVLTGLSRRPGGAASERGSGLGWEGRLLLAGIAAATGIATAAYLALTAYLVGLIALKIITRTVAQQPASGRAASGRAASARAASASNVR